MRTHCYCIYCQNHPKFNIRHTFDYPATGFDVHRFIDPKFDEQSAIVNCLEPSCGAIEKEIIDPNDYKFPVTAYADGCSWTGFWNVDGISIHASCKAEKYKP